MRLNRASSIGVNSLQQRGDVEPDTSASRSVSMVVPKPETITASQALVEALERAGVTHAFGLLGGAIAPFCQAVSQSSIELMHFRHEAGAAFAAIEMSIATGRPVVVFSTTGPGLTNSLTGMAAARWEGAKVIFVSGATPSSQRGRGAFQETSSYTLPVTGLFSAGPLFHFAALVESPAELEVAAARINVGVTRAGGFVAHLGLPIALQTAELSQPFVTSVGTLPPGGCSATDAAMCAELLSNEPFVIWVGFGARHAADEVRELARRSGARVMCSPRAKGIFPEDDPQFLGVTGLGGHAVVEAALRDEPVQRALVLGTKLGEFTSFWSQGLVPAAGLVHVDVDAEAFGSAFPSTPTLGVQSEVKAFLRELLAAWPEGTTPPAVEAPKRPVTPTMPRGQGPVRPSFLMGRVQRHVIDASDAIVLTEAGNSFALGSYYLRFAEPGRYRVSSGFGSMGHAVSGVLGAALGPRRKAVAIVGDGAMLMQSEINTAAQYKIDAVWIVLNDARYGMIEQGMRAIGWSPFETGFPRADFAAIARGMGGEGVCVTRECDLDDALATAMRANGPFVVDVLVDPDELAPSRGRNDSLVKQGVTNNVRDLRR